MDAPKHWERPLNHLSTLAELISREALHPETAKHLEAAVKSGARICVYGERKSGRTTLLAALTGAVPLRCTVKVWGDGPDLHRQGLVPAETPTGVSTRHAADTDADAGRVLRAAAAEEAGASVAVDAGSLEEAKRRLGDAAAHVDLYVGTKRESTSVGGKRTDRRYVAHVVAETENESEVLSEGYLDPWGNPKHRVRTQSSRQRTGTSSQWSTVATSTHPSSVTAGRTIDPHVASTYLPQGKQTKEEARFLLGHDEDRNPVTVSGKELGMHGLLLGATGTGLSEVTTNLVRDAHAAGWDTSVLDARGWGEGLRETLERDGVPVRCAGGGGKERLDPVTGLTGYSAAAVLCSMLPVLEPYWDALARKVILSLTTSWHRAQAHGEAPDLTARRVVDCLLADSLGEATSGLARRDDVLASPSADEQRAAHTAGTHLSILLRTGRGPGDADGGLLGHESLNLAAAGTSVLTAPGRGSVEGGAITAALTQLNSLVVRRARAEDPALLTPAWSRVRRLAAAARETLGDGADLEAVRDQVRAELDDWAETRLTSEQRALPEAEREAVKEAKLERQGLLQALTHLEEPSEEVRRRLVLLLGAGSMPQNLVEDLLSRGRAAGVAVVLAEQGLGSFETPDRIVQNVNVVVAAGQASEDEARSVSGLLGTVTETSVHRTLRDGVVSEETVASTREVPAYEPRELRDLAPGEVILKVARPERRAGWVSVQRR